MSLRGRLGALWARRAAREGLAAFLAQALLVVAFLWTPLSNYEEVHYSSADLTQAMSLTRIEPGHRPGNQLQSDAVTQMQPWLLFNRAELCAGRFPLWNPWNGAGAPHFANYQSAVLSPFSVPFYVLGFKPALLVSAALKLLALGLFTYLFLRALGCGWTAATVGGAAFQFAGHNVLLLYFPHVGAMVALPAGVWCAELALRRAEAALAAGRGARLFGPLAGLTASLLVGLLAGNPEPFYFSALGVGGWISVRLVSLWRAHARDAARRAEILRVAGKIALACVLAAGFASVQVLPFLEYLQGSRVLEQRSLRQTPLEARWWPLMLFPDVLGNPGSAYKISDGVPPPNYELVNASYVGGAVLLLACLCPLLARRRRGGLFFPVAAALWFAYAHDLCGIDDLIARLPTFDMAPMNRSQGLWNFALACAAAIALDALIAREGPRAWLAAGWTLVATGAGVTACLLGADRLIAEFSQVPSPNHHLFLRYVPEHLALMSTWTGGAALAVAGLFVLRTRPARVALGALVGLLVFAQTGWLLRDYNPVSPDRFVFPRTPAIEELARAVGHERLAILGQDGIPPDSNLVYGLNQLANYDGMWVRDFDLLYRDHFGDTDNWRPIVTGSHRSLRLFGTRWVLAKWGWNLLDRGLREFPKDKDLAPVPLELLPGSPVTQTFQCTEGGLSRVMAVLSTPRKVRDCTLRMRLEDLATGRVVSEQTLGSRAIQATVYTGQHVTWPGEYALNPAGRPVVFKVPPQPDSARRDYRLTLACEDGVGGDTIYAWHMPVLGYGPGTSRVGGRPLPGELLFDWTCGEDRNYEEVAAIGDYTLLRLREALPHYAMREFTILAESAQEALGLVRLRSFDPRHPIVLGVGDEATRRAIVEATAAARERRVVQFTDSDWCYLVSADGKRLAHIDDEATFLANRFAWEQIEHLPPAERARFELIPDTDLEAKRAAGLRLITPPSGDEGPPEVLEETPTRIRLRVVRKRVGYLSVANTWDPGWRARLGDEEVPVLRANVAFQAVEIPPGTWEVELYYLPRSLVLGLWLAAGSGLVAAGAWVLARRARGRPTPLP